MGTIKINNQSISKLYLGNISVKRAYSNGSIVYDSSVAPTPQPCFEVVSNISQASGDYVDVYAWDTEKWYKKNNMSQYEEYGIMPIVSDLSSTSYYTGKLVILSTDGHEYKWTDSQWNDLGYAGISYNVIWLDPSSNNSSYNIGYYWGTGYKMVCNVYLSGSYGSDTAGFLNHQNQSPLEFNFYSNGFYLDMHNPQSTSNNSCYSGDYSYRLMQTSVLQNYQSEQVINFTFTYGTVKAELEEGGTLIGTWGTERTGQSWYNGLYSPSISIGSAKPYHLSRIQVYDKNNNLVNDLKFVENEGETGSQKLSMYDSVLDVKYDNTNSNTPTYHITKKGEINPPEEYQTKVAPANNVHYNKLEELELMECPWIGMKATVGQDYTLYVYTENGWVIGDVPLNLPYLRFTALEDTTFTFKKSGYASKDLEIKYSIDGGEWKTMVSGVATPIVKSGSYVLLKSNFHGATGNKVANGTFSSTGNFDLTGNSMSLIYGDEFENQLSLKGKQSVFHSLFKNCTKLKSVSNSVLPATTLSNRCYYYMFGNCTGITSIQEGLLPATTLSDYCYSYMFRDCTGITSIPAGLLPATTLSASCYYYMFNGCTGLKSLPAGLLPATTLATSCYYYMFNGCTGLKSLPEGLLPATTLYESCYSYMFNGCTGLKSLPAGLLPATTLYESCYSYMFNGCTALTSLPSGLLPAITLSTECYYYMFCNCTGITSLQEGLLPANTLAQSCYSNMFSGCTGITSIPSGLLPATTLSTKCYSHMFSGCTGLTSIPSGILPATKLANSCYSNMFYGSCITSIPSGLLPATTLSTSCYSYMFGNCTGITSIQEGLLPSTTLSASCYSHMFIGCTGITSIPSGLLPATTLATSCYYSMFGNCTGITSIPSGLLPATNLANNCYKDMFSECTNIKSADIELPATTVNKTMVYYNMFFNCNNLTDSPIIKATSVSGTNPFGRMFYGCAQMKYLMCDMLNEPSSSISKDWLNGVAATGTFYISQDATWDSTVSRDANGVPAGWTIEKANP